MLPSKGYFKSLNCPYYDNGFCDRPHCHFRHTKRERAPDDLSQLETTGVQPTLLNDKINDILLDIEGDRRQTAWVSQLPSSANVSYKPTPIAELQKRHIPVTTAPTHKRSIEYDIKVVRKPKTQYVPELLNNYDNDSNSESLFLSLATNPIYKATKIGDDCERLSSPLFSRTDTEEIPPPKDSEESGDEIDFDQVSSELNLLDEFLKEYNSPEQNDIAELKVSSNSLNLSSAKGIVKNSQQTDKAANVENGFVNNFSHPFHKESKYSLSESDQINLNECANLSESNKIFAKSSSVENKPVSCGFLEIPKQSNDLNSKIPSYSKTDEKTIISLQKKKSSSISESDKSKKTDCDTFSSSFENTQSKKESGNDNAPEKVLKNQDHLSNTSKHIKKEHSSSKSSSKESNNNNNRSKHSNSSTKTSKYESDSKNNASQHNSCSNSKKESKHKNSHDKRSRKDSEHKSSSSKQSKKDHEHKSRSKSPKKDTDHKNILCAKSTKTESEIYSKRRNSNSEGIGIVKKHKTDHNSKHKHSENTSSRDIRKSSGEKPFKRERYEKDRHRKEKLSSSRDSGRKGRRDSESVQMNKSTTKKTNIDNEHDNSDDEVEIISDSESIIVIDSEEDSCTEQEEPKSKKRKIESSLTLSPPPSPVFPSDDSLDAFSSDNNKSSDKEESSIATLKQDDSTLLDHRVQSRIKSRVSLGMAYRPPVKKSVEIMTPAKRLLLFKKLKEQEEKDNVEQNSAGRVRIGCVPNVKLLLQEKQRMLQGKRPSVTTMGSSYSKKPTNLLPNDPNDKDEPPKLVKNNNQYLSKKDGAPICERQRWIESLYKIARHLVLPGHPYQEAKDKCVQIENRVWWDSNIKTYSHLMKQELENLESKIPEFSLKHYKEIQPRRSYMFPEYLRKRKNSIDDKSTEDVEEVSVYRALQPYLLSEEDLENEGYPRFKPDGSGLAYINAASLEKWKRTQNGRAPAGELTCAKCSNFFSVDEDGLSNDLNGCRYHLKKACRTEKRNGQLFRFHKCCSKPPGKPCMSSTYHSPELTDFQNMEGFVETKDPKGPEPEEGRGVFAVDCEMYWSTVGLELGRVSVVNMENRIVYDTFVKPERLVTDYCTRMSGLTEDKLKEAPVTLKEVQNSLLEIFNNKTILIGHSLENDLKVLKIIHSTVIDTAIMYKTSQNWKKSLKDLSTELLSQVIQNEEDGHSSAEDAMACIKLVTHRLMKDAHAASRKNPPVLKSRYSSMKQPLLASD